MAVTFGAVGAIVGFSTTPTSVAYPAGITAGDLLVLVGLPKIGNSALAAQPAVAGFTAQGWVRHGTTASANDAGSMAAMVWTKVATGTESGTISVAWGFTPGAGQAFMVRLANVTDVWDIGVSVVARTLTSTGWSVTFPTTPAGITSGDLVHVINAVPTDANTASAAGVLTATGLTAGAATATIAHQISATGTDSAIWADRFTPTAGTATSAATYTSTLTGGANLYGVSVLVRARETVAAKAGTATGTWTYAGTAAGARTSSGTGTGTLAYAGTSAGGRGSSGAGAGAYAYAGTASGAKLTNGTGSGVWAFTGSATGVLLANGVGSGLLDYTGAAEGKADHKGAASESYGWALTADGAAPPGIPGYDAGYTSGYGVSLLPTEGTATGLTEYAGVAAGVGPSGGTADGSWGFTGTAAGARSRAGTAIDGWGFTGVAVGNPTRRASGGGAWRFNGAASGVRTVLYLPTGSSVGVTATVGTAHAVNTYSGAASGSWHTIGVAFGLDLFTFTFDIPDGDIIRVQWRVGKPVTYWQTDASRTAWRAGAPTLTQTRPPEVPVPPFVDSVFYGDGYDDGGYGIFSAFYGVGYDGGYGLTFYDEGYGALSRYAEGYTTAGY